MTDLYSLLSPVQLGDFSSELLSDKTLRQSFIYEDIPVPNQEMNIKISLDYQTVKSTGVDFFSIDSGIPAFSGNAMEKFPKDLLDEFSFHPVTLQFKGGATIFYAAKTKVYRNIIDEDKTDTKIIGGTSIILKPIFKREAFGFYAARDKKYQRILAFSEKMIDIIRSNSLKIEYLKQ